MALVTISPRFNGPPTSANGGYTCGVVAEAIDAPAARVSLRRPPPLGVPLHLEPRPDGGAALLDAEGRVVADGTPADLALEPPAPPALEEARAAVARFPAYERHAFPSCFVCGPARAEGDGLRIFPGPVEGRDDGLIAADWTPLETDTRTVWAALDCPTAFVCDNDTVIVLAALAASVAGPVVPGEPHVVTAWPLGRDGRKHRSGSAIHSADGAVVAVAEALWIEVRDPAAFAAST